MSGITYACSGLACGYPGRTVVSEVELTVQSGQALVLLGRNGSGKSTLLKTLAREIGPLAGSIAFEGKPLGAYSHGELASRLAVVPQEELLAFPFTVEEVVLMGRIAASNSVFDSDEDRQIAEDAMASCDCHDLRHRPLNELSGGERQRVLIARALAQRATTLLLDEPSTHLDIAHQIELMKLLRGLVVEGYTVVAALHDLNLAALLGDRVLLLGEGRVQLQGELQDCLNSPKIDDIFGVQFDRMPAEGAQALRLVARA